MFVCQITVSDLGSQYKLRYKLSTIQNKNILLKRKNYLNKTDFNKKYLLINWLKYLSMKKEKFEKEGIHHDKIKVTSLKNAIPTIMFH